MLYRTGLFHEKFNAFHLTNKAIKQFKQEAVKIGTDAILLLGKSKRGTIYIGYENFKTKYKLKAIPIKFKMICQHQTGK